MKDPKEVRAEIDAIKPVSLWGCRKEIRDLSTKLFADEHIAGLVRVFSQSTICLLVATDKRLIIMDNFTFYGTDHKDISYMQISGVDYNTRLFFGKIIIEDQTGRNYYDYALNRDLRKFVNVLLEKVNAYRDKFLDRRVHVESDDEVADEIDKLWTLVEKGALTQAEYEKRKAKLLDK
ncbi:PH domain-containing protein [bacterium]|nr:PH domain-containing protein [bacterium]MBQ6436777.1 PH domain-containing protein [bacterium]